MTMADRYIDQQRKARGLDFVPEAREEDSEIAYVKPAVGSSYYNSFSSFSGGQRRASVSFFLFG